MRRLSKESGQTLVIVALSLTCVLGFVGLATDVGILMHAKRQMQAAADSAAIAGALELKYGNVNAAALDAASRNGVVDGANGAAVTVHHPPAMGPHTGSVAYVEVVASEANPTYFLRVFHIGSMNVAARAVATLGSGNGCVYTLNPTGNGIWMNGSGDLNVPDCGIVVNSNDPTNALRMNGSGTIRAASIGVVGQYHQNGSGSITPTPVTGITPVSDPLAFLSPPAFSPSSCLPNPKITGSKGGTLGPASPGGVVCYNGISIKGSGSVQFNPGIYVVNGAFDIAGSSAVQGTGVTFYLPPGASFSDSGSSTLKLTAPTSGAYNGILFYQDPANSDSPTINGSGSSVLTGIFYFPGAQLTLNGSNGTTFNAAFVTGSLRMNGSGQFNNYSLLNGSSPLTAALLVE